MPDAELLTFFKALADDTRLKLVGLLAQEAYSGEQLALLLAVKPATISHHLAKLTEAGLVRAEMDGHSKMYSLRLDAIQGMAKHLLAADTLPAAAEDVDSSAYDRKVMKDFSNPDGTLKKLPAQEKKFQAILRHLVNEFEPGREYSEKEVNAVFKKFHTDTASLRRGMIEYKLMKRASGKYWRT